MLTGEQLRAARAMLRMEQSDLAERAGVSVETVRRLEAIEGPLSGRDGTITRVINVLRLAGIEFIDEDGTDGRAGSGVRFAVDEVSAHYRKQIALLIRDLTDEALLAALKQDRQLFERGGDHIAAVLVKMLPKAIKADVPSTFNSLALRLKSEEREG
jgi:transcriptional regulator with XRE-family HTH domain